MRLRLGEIWDRKQSLGWIEIDRPDHGTLGATSAPPGPLGPAGLGMAWHNAGLWAGDNMKYHEITL